MPSQPCQKQLLLLSDYHKERADGSDLTAAATSPVRSAALGSCTPLPRARRRPSKKQQCTPSTETALPSPFPPSAPNPLLPEASAARFLPFCMHPQGDTLKGTYKHCQEEQLGKIGAGGPCKKHFQNVKDKFNIEKSGKTRQPWSREESDFNFFCFLYEDKILIQMINSGQTNWGTVACAIPGRNAQQCRLRWTCTLDPAINKQAWSQEEELRLIRAQQTYGNKWSAMVEHFPGRTNNAIKEHWRGPMKRKLNSYLSSGFLEKIPDLPASLKSKHGARSKSSGLFEKSSGLPENLSVSQNSDSDILQQCDGSSDENQLLSDIQGRLKSKQGTSSKSKQGASSKCDGSSDENQLLSDLRSSLKSKQGASSKRDNSSDEDELLSGLRARLKSKQGTNKKSKQEFIKPRENTDQSEGECAEFMCTKGPDTDSVDVSQRIKDRVNERKRARKRLVLLSSPVELKVSAMAKSERPQQEGKQMSPEVNIISPPAILQEFSPEVPSECEKMVEPLVADCKQAKNVCSSLKTSDPCTLEQHLADISDLLDMSYCDGLMIIPPAGCANDDCFV
uniref:Myb-like domain-containing protein n=1 Tax=Leersia perrieri TaxID=77586 RepID=A0A0D9VEM4_9ORYZ